MKKHCALLFFSFCCLLNFHAQITLSHNVGNTPIKTDWESCDEEEVWARTFTLSEFGINNDEQFIIRSAQVAISNAQLGSGIMISISAIDDNFPNSQGKRLSYNFYEETPLIGDTPEIITFNFSNPVVVPSKTTRILVTVEQSNVLQNGVEKILIAGTEEDTGTSWFYGCRQYYTFIETQNLDNPKPKANFFINVTGEKRTITSNVDEIMLSHNVSDDLIQTSMPSCSGGVMSWARTFDLEDFGISTNEEFIINAGDIGITGAGWLANVTYHIYEIDENFPDSFSKDKLIGSSQKKIISAFSWNSTSAKIITTDFEQPIVVPADVKKILVEVERGIEYGDGLLFISGTEQETEDSWFKGNCPFNTNNKFEKMSNLTTYGSDINFYITVNGQVKTIFPFEITNDNTCSNFSNNFSLTNQTEVQSVIWDFDDPNSGTNNTSTLIDVNHQFTSAGIYNVTATVTHIDNTTYTIPKEIEIFEAPNINKNVSLKQCDNSDINGFSFFNLNEVKEKIISNADDYTITFFEERSQAATKTLPITNITNYQNEQVSSDTIWARAENINGCYEISEVNLLVSTTEIPVSFLKSYYKCDDGTDNSDGIATFNFSDITNEIINIFPINQQLIITYYRNEVDALAEVNSISDITNYQNTDSPYQQDIFVRVDSQVDNACLGLGAHISLIVEKIPIANPVIIEPECDNDRDGLFAFNTSTIESTIIGNQTNVSVRYFDENNIELPSPLPNPFITASQGVRVIIENSDSNDIDGKCSSETMLNFIVNSVPVANPVAIQEECDSDFDGLYAFDTSNIESTIIGSQTGLIISYFDENGTALPSPLPNPFLTSSQNITVRLENPNYDVCAVESNIQFIVREKPTVTLPTEDIICMSNFSELEIMVDNPNPDYTYTWRDKSDKIIGSSYLAKVTKGGIYNVVATSIFGCDSDMQEIEISESSISDLTINDIQVQDDSDNNFIRINTGNIGLGDYEFRLLDNFSNIIFDYQDSPDFENLEGGNYILQINDKNNCGTSNFEISLISFPDFFTPNGDNSNDFWQIKGIQKGFYKEGIISIFNRYGKLITSFTINDLGWDGSYNGKPLNSNSYWFKATLINQQDQIKNRTGNFSLIRN